MRLKVIIAALALAACDKPHEDKPVGSENMSAGIGTEEEMEQIAQAVLAENNRVNSEDARAAPLPPANYLGTDEATQRANAQQRRIESLEYRVERLERAEQERVISGR